MGFLLSFIGVLLAISKVQGDAACEDSDWVEYDGKCYKFTTNHNKKLSDAMHYCHLHHSKLLVIDTAGEDNFIRTKLFLNGPEDHHEHNLYFTGAININQNDPSHHDGFAHVSQNMWISMETDAPITFSNWAAGYPYQNGQTSSAACLSLQYGFLWVNVDLFHESCGVICEKHLQQND